MKSAQKKAVPLVSINELELFRLMPEGARLFEMQVEPFGVIIATGLYRTGKSYLLNQLIGECRFMFGLASVLLIGESGCFTVDATTEACTRGIWVARKTVMTSKGEMMLYIMDCEGFGAVEKSLNFDVKLFTLAVLLGSYLIYNSVNSLDENAVQQLSMVTELSKKIKVSEDENMDASSYFPKLLWIVRDFHLELVDEYGSPISNDDYLESALGEQTGFTKEIMERNKIRTLLKAYFKERHCFTMVRPAHEEKDLQRLSGSISKKRELFEKQLQEVKELIFTSIQPKSIGGVPMLGKAYLGFIEKIIQALNKGAIPTIKDAWEDVMEQQSRKAFDKALEIYHSEINSILSNISTQDLDTLRKTQEKLEDQLKKYLEKELRSYSRLPELITKLMSQIQEAYRTKKKELQIKLDRDAQEILHSEYRKIMGDNYGSLEEMFAAFKNLEEVFFSKVKVQNKIEIFYNFQKEKLKFMADRVVKNIQNQNDMLLHTKDSEISTLKEMAKMKEDSNKAVTDRRFTEMNEKLLSNQRRVKDLENTVEAATRMIGEKDEEIQKLEEQIKSMKMQYMRISGQGSLRPSNYGEIKLESEESIAICGKGGDCTLFQWIKL